MFGYQLVFIFPELAFNNLLYQINRYIHIGAFLLGADNVALYRNGYLNLLMFFLHTQGYVNFRIRSKVPF